jgi:hypothetical protein
VAYALRNLVETWKIREFGYRLQSTWVPCVVFADDIVLVAKSSAEGQRLLVELKVVLNQIGLELSQHKCNASVTMKRTGIPSSPGGRKCKKYHAMKASRF